MGLNLVTLLYLVASVCTRRIDYHPDWRGGHACGGEHAQ